MLTDKQKADLAAPLNRSNIKKNPKGFDYVEGWHAIAEANRIFGFDGWTRETVDVTCVSERERTIGASNGRPGYQGWGVTYTARVRIRVGDLIREGCGAGHGIDKDCGQAHESALKEAETDAMKRALMTFGNPFGLALYDRTQSNVESEEDASKARYITACKQRIQSHVNGKDALGKWWKDQSQALRDYGLTQAEVDELKTMVIERGTLLDSKADIRMAG